MEQLTNRLVLYDLFSSGKSLYRSYRIEKLNYHISVIPKSTLDRGRLFEVNVYSRIDWKIKIKEVKNSKIKISVLNAFICWNVVYNMKHKKGLLDWNWTSETAKKKRDNFQILVLSIGNDLEIISFRISVKQINEIKPVLNLWCFYISCVTRGCCSVTGKQGALLTKKKLCWGYLIEGGRLTEEIP